MNKACVLRLAPLTILCHMSNSNPIKLELYNVCATVERLMEHTVGPVRLYDSSGRQNVNLYDRQHDVKITCRRSGGSKRAHTKLHVSQLTSVIYDLDPGSLKVTHIL